ncbi:MAG: hypothetical protein M5U28_14450 [Sandaracinaceae bacterium]|nr:hypothetical protein [Sandaracinaceae bacterium]
MKGTGEGGRITREDVMKAASPGAPAARAAYASAEPSARRAAPTAAPVGGAFRLPPTCRSPATRSSPSPGAAASSRSTWSTRS